MEWSDKRPFERDLDSGWRIALDPGNTGKQDGWMNAVRPEAVPAVVPGNISDSIDTFTRGVAWYWIRFSLDGPVPGDLEYALKAGYTEWVAEYWLNGVFAGSFTGTRLNYELDVTGAVRPGENLLAVRIVSPTSGGIDGWQFGGEFQEVRDNAVIYTPCNIVTSARNVNSAYGGIRYPVRLAARPRLRTGRTVLRSDWENGSFRAETTILNATGSPPPLRLTFMILDGAGETVFSEARDLDAVPGDTAAVFTGRVPARHLWDTDSPYLYTALLSLSCGEEILHTQSVRFGFRDFRVKDGFFCLNGRRIFLKCAHTSFECPTWKNSPWDRTCLRGEMLRAKAMGHNALRYLSSDVWPEILDFCDEIGLMLYQEHPASWDMHPDNPYLEEQFLFHARGVLERDVNHPCFTMFGLVNESHSARERECAKSALPSLRETDDSRLFLLGSGRWDGEWRVGSVSNPGSWEWECVWGAERPDAPEEPDLYQCGFGREDLVRYGGVWGEREDHLTCWTPEQGDTHIYPRIPMTPRAVDILRTHSKGQKPAFLSEGSHNSMGNPMRLRRKAEEAGFGENRAYWWMERIREERFREDFFRYGLDELFGVPEDVPLASYPLNAKQRRFFFDCVRSNPQFCGISYTNVLELASGAGMIQFERDQYKPFMCDAVADSLAPLHWCVFTEPSHVYAGRPFTVEAVLASEDVLGPGTYPVTARIVSREHGRAWEHHTALTIPQPPEGGLLPLSFPVFRETVTLDMPEGEYELTVYLEHGGWPTGGRKTVFLTVHRPLADRRAAMIGLPEDVKAWLRRNGTAEDPESRLLLVGLMPEDDDAWARLWERVQNGASAVFLLPETLLQGVEEPFNTWKEYVPERLPFSEKGKLTYADNWHYHTYGAVKAHPYTKGLPKGLMDDDVFMQATPEFVFFDQPVPDETAALSIGLPYYTHIGEGTAAYLFGVTLGVYRHGAGRIILNCFKLFDAYGDSPAHANLDRNPAADRLLLNVIEHESSLLGE